MIGDASESLTIGRSVASDVALDWDSEVSRVPARLERVGGEWTFVDDGGSRNGSFIDGERVRGRRRLRDGDAILLGQTVVVFRSPHGRESLRTATSERLPLPKVSEAQLRVLTVLCRPYAANAFAVPPSNKQIADELVIGVETVKSHMRALFEACGVRDLPQHQKRAALAQRALETGLVAFSSAP